jgi:hypothetical protein
MTAAARLHDLALSESGFVFDPYSGGTFTVNRTGMTLLRALRDGLPRAAVIDLLRQEFQVSGDADVDSDIGEFARLLVQHGLVAPDFTLDNDAASTGATP